MSMGGQHFHHYNIGIAALSVISGLSLRWGEDFNTSPLHPIAYGFANALIADEAALLLDLDDIYWAKEGRKSVDLALATIGLGGPAVAVAPWMTHSRSRHPNA